MKKNKIRTVLLLCLFTVILAGCGGSDNSASKDLPPDSIDHVDAEKIVDSFTLGEATINLTQDWYYEKAETGADSVNEYYLIYFDKEKPEKTFDLMWINRYPNVVTGGTAPEDKIKELLEAFKTTYQNDIYKGSLVTTAEHITRSGRPAYHFVLYEEDKGFTYDNYMFFINASDVLVSTYMRSDQSTEDYSKEFIELVRNIDCPLDAELAEDDSEAETESTETEATETEEVKDNDLSEATIKMLVKDALYNEVEDHYSSADPSSCKYNINKTERDGEKIYVYGKLTLYDKYGELTSDPFKKFDVEITGTRVTKCTISS